MATAIVAPAAVVSVSALQGRILENGAGVYTLNFVIPPDSTLIDIIVEAEALWTAATSAGLDIGDAGAATGFLAALNLKATDLLAGESISLGSTQVRGGAGGSYTTVGTSTHLNRRYAQAGQTIVATVTSVGAGTAGRTRITVLYSTGLATNITL